MLEIITNFLSRRRTSRTRPKVRSPQRSRPHLETLEDRLAPAGTFTWVGGDPGNVNTWADQKNWIAVGANETYPGQNNEINDFVKFDNNAKADAYLLNNLTVQTLTLAANFGFKFEVQGGKTLTDATPTGTVGANFFDMEGGTLNLRGGASLALDGGAPNMGSSSALWSGGDFNSAGDLNGKVYIYKGIQFTIQENAAKLGATLIIGQSPAGVDATATVQLASKDGTVGLAGNLSLYKNASIQVKPQGIFLLNQQSSSNTKGGIVNSAFSNGAIDNQGQIARVVVDMTNTNYLTIGPTVTNSAAGALFTMNNNTKIDFQGTFVLQKGILSKAAGSDNKGKIIEPPGGTGTIEIEPAGTVGRYSVFFSDDVIFQAGSTGGIVFDNILPGAFATLNFAGQLDLEAGNYVSLNVDGGTGQSDILFVSGLTTLNAATLNVYTENQSYPGSGFLFFTAMGGLAGSGWYGNPVNSGYPANYVFDSPSTFHSI